MVLLQMFCKDIYFQYEGTNHTKVDTIIGGKGYLQLFYAGAKRGICSP